MIDMSKDELITFAEIARRLPRAPGNKHLHVATVHRWRSTGIKGVRLEAVRIGGGSWLSTWDAVQRFINALSSAESARPNQVNPSIDAACKAAGY